MRKAITTLTAAAAFLASGHACALAQTFDVKQLEVSKGELEFGPENMYATGLPGYRGSDVNRFATEKTLLYGLTDWWKISAALKIERPEELDLRLSQVAFASIFVLKPVADEKKRDFGFGWFSEVSLAVHDDATNAAVFGPIATLKADKLAFTANPFFEKTFDQNREQGIAFVYGWQVKYELRDGFGVGVEGFGVIDDIGNSPPVAEQEHRVGPVVYTELPIRSDYKIGMDAGVMFGLTRATPDLAFKLNFAVPLLQSPEDKANGNGKHGSRLK